MGGLEKKITILKHEVLKLSPLKPKKGSLPLSHNIVPNSTSLK